jgi:hypothetical protein
MPLPRLRHIINEVKDINNFIYNLPLETAENEVGNNFGPS